MHRIITLVLLYAIQTSPILIPLSDSEPRCVVIYSIGDIETVKVDIEFPTLLNHNDYYQISWKNTENGQLAAEIFYSGRYRRQLKLSTNVIYDFCLQMFAPRNQKTVLVDYSAVNVFAFNQAQIKVPTGILKSSDMTNAFLSAEDIDRYLDFFQQMQINRTDTHEQMLRKTDSITEKLVLISIFELVLIVCAGAYEFWSIWKYLKSRHFV